LSEQESSSSGTTRRNAVKYGIAAVAAAALGAAGGWSIGRSTVPAVPPTEVTERTITTTVSKAEERPQVIKIGVLVEQSGPLAGLGSEMIAGTELAKKVINNSGGILGTPVEVVYSDTRSTVEGSVSSAEQLITRDRVNYLLGPWDSGAAFAVADVTAKYRILWISTVGGGDEFNAKIGKDLEKYKYVWYTNFNWMGVQGCYLGQIDDMVDNNIWKPKAKKLALITESLDWPQIARGIWKDWANKRGWELVMDEVVDFGQSEFTSIIAKAKEKGATVLHWEVGNWAQINKQIYESGIEAWNVMGYSGWSSELPEISKTAGNLGLCMAEKHPGWFKTICKDESGLDSSISYAVHQFGAMMLLRDLIHKVDSLDKDKINSALETVGKTWQLEGVRGWWRFGDKHDVWVAFQHPESKSKDQPIGLGIRAIGTQLIDGKWYATWPPELRERMYVLPDWAK
jgi:branched-chain amino acid transport system substrate-binding protein